MTEINVILINLMNRIHDITGKDVYILDDLPAVQKDAIYIVTPASSGIRCKHWIGGGSFVDYDIHIYELTHVADSNRQNNVGNVVMDAYNHVNSVLYKCFDSFRGMKKIVTATIYRTEFGTSTWVVNTKVYTAYDMTLSIKDTICD